MKMKRFLALFLIALMATTVVSAAGVLTAEKAAAQSFDNWPNHVLYRPGKTYVFMPWKYNDHWTWSDLEGTPRHNEFANWATASVSAKTTETQQARSFAGVGVNMQLHGITDEMLNDPSRTCTVTMKVGYVLKAQGDANVGTYPCVEGIVVAAAYDLQGDANGEVRTALVKTVTFTYPVGRIFRADDGNVYGTTGIGASLYNYGAGQAAASVTLYSFAIKFN